MGGKLHFPNRKGDDRMKALILCDKESSLFCGVDLRSHAQAAVIEAGSEAEIVDLDGDQIAPCLGCFQCWTKTPGLCIQTHDCANRVAGQEIQSDVVIFLSKITYGGYSYDIKAFLDRSIPNISPFFENVHGETHHKMRYERFPYMMTIGYGEYTARERETFIRLAERNARNMRPPKHFVYTARNADEVNETIRSLKNALLCEVRL